MVKKYIDNIKHSFHHMFDQLIQADSMAKIKAQEIRLIIRFIAPVITLASFINLYLGYHWDIRPVHIWLYFITLNIISSAMLFIDNSVISTKFKSHSISVLMLIASAMTYYIYIEKMGILFWFILIIMMLISVANTNITLLFYFSIPQYLFLWPFFSTRINTNVLLDSNFIIASAILFMMIQSAAFLINRNYTMVIRKKIDQFNRLTIQNEEIAALYEQNMAAEKELRNQYDQLNAYNTQIINNQKQLEYLAYYDELTALPNRKMLFEQLDFLIRNYQETQNVFTLVFIDLDFFKKINDLMGHITGDKLLIAIALRLKKRLYEDDILCRLGGDELALIVKRKITEEDLFQHVESLKDTFEESFEIDHKKINITGSFGIATYPADGKTSEDLLIAADTAMYKAKELGKNNIQFFKQGLKHEILAKIELERNLLGAIDRNELYLNYQPIYTTDKVLSGFEALLRWHSEKLGQIAPSVFIPLAEEIGMIDKLGKWVIESVCHQIQATEKNYKKAFFISLNISTLQINSPDFLEHFFDVIHKTGISPDHLKVEITESVFIDHISNAIYVIDSLRKAGIAISLDDFGTGYSSLSYLMDLPIDILKIDRAFMNAIDSRDKWPIVGSIIQMAHSLNMTVVAEGVETASQLNFLTQESCDFIQGYYFSKPLSVAQMDELLDAQK